MQVQCTAVSALTGALCMYSVHCYCIQDVSCKVTVCTVATLGETSRVVKVHVITTGGSLYKCRLQLLLPVIGSILLYHYNDILSVCKI